jgi:hypothetical protein
MSNYNKEINRAKLNNNSIDKKYSNILSTFMSFESQNFPIFNQVMPTSKEKFIISELISDYAICLNKINKP